jgi:tetratricopeptide (TPR) repeat protein
MLRFSFVIAVIVTTTCCSTWSGTTAWAQQPSAQKDPRIGTRVLITTAGAELRTPKSTVWRAYLGDVFTVTLTNGEWLWIHEKGGWLWEKDTVPYETAIEELSKKLLAKPTAENYHLRGIALLAHDKYDRAIADFNESLRRQPRNSGALNNRGKAHYLNQDYDLAIADFTAAIQQDPKNVLAFNNRALARISTEDYRQARADLQSALRIVPEYAEALNNRGVVHQKLGQHKQAIDDFTAALKIDAAYADALGNRAYTYRLTGDYSKAVADLEEAVKLTPGTFEASNDLAWLLATAKDDNVRDAARALKLAEEACGISQYQDWNTLDTLGAAFAANGKFDEAATWLTTALELAPEEKKPRIQKHLDLVMKSETIRE